MPGCQAPTRGRAAFGAYCKQHTSGYCVSAKPCLAPLTMPRCWTDHALSQSLLDRLRRVSC